MLGTWKNLLVVSSKRPNTVDSSVDKSTQASNPSSFLKQQRKQEEEFKEA